MQSKIGEFVSYLRDLETRIDNLEVSNKSMKTRLDRVENENKELIRARNENQGRREDQVI